MSRSMTTAEARQTGRIGGLSKWARDPAAARALLAEARAKADARFVNESERKLFYCRLALKSAKARKARKAMP